MKMRKRISVLISVLLVLVLSVTLFADSAEGYTGTEDGVTELLSEYDKANSEKGKLNALEKIITYLKTVDPESENIEELYSETDLRIIDLAKSYLSDFSDGDSPASKHSSRDLVRDFIISHPFYTESEAVSAFMEELDDFTVGIRDDYLEELKALTDTESKRALLDGLNTLISGYSIECSDDFYAELSSETFKIATDYLSALEELTSVAERGALIRRIDGFLADNSIGEPSEELDAFLSALAEEKNSYLRDMKEERNTAYNKAYIKDFIAPVRYNLTFDDKGTGVLIPTGNKDGDNVISFVGEDSGMDGENRYYTVRYDMEKKHVRTTLDLTNVTDAAVIEFDLTTFDRLPDRCIWFEDVGRTNGATWSIMYFSITPNGDIAADGSGNQIILKNAITPGEWTHFSLTVEHSTGNVCLYIDYDLVYETNKCHPTLGYKYSPETLIMGANPTTAGSSFSIDNVKVYGGHSPRDVDWYNNASLEDLFIYYSDAAQNEDLHPRARRDYYDAAKVSLPAYYKDGEYLVDNPEIVAAVDKLLSIDYEALKTQIKESNLEKYEEYYLRLKGLELGEGTVSVRSYWLGEADSFLGTTGGLITDGELYDSIVSYMSDMRYLIDMEKMAAEFATYVNTFYSASSVELKKSSYDSALLLIDSIDRAVINDRTLYPMYYDALDRAAEMDTVLYEKICIDNSKKLLAIITYVMDGNLTEQSWDENYDRLEGYVDQARSLISSGLIDVYYKELYKLIDDFAPMNEYFYERAQLGHIEHFESELERFENSEQYFKKFGILTKLKEYVSINDVDTENETMKALIARVDAELLVLKDKEVEYEQTLAENTARFVEICSGLVGSVDYKTMKEIVAEASVYYYTMSVDLASVQDAIAVYKLRRDEIKAKESYANEFIMLSEAINAESDDALALIIDCAAYLDYLERGVDGVEPAITLFEEKKTEYDARVACVNREVEKTVLVSAYQRNYSDMGSFISLIVDVAIGSWALRGDLN